tara:strand:+ start:573 stop:1640 length:1068 start_codon:yes stop_codon:yes gene_type:complete
MDKYKIDSHKLIYHVPRVNDWLNGKLIYPIYMEISPSGACNHRCTYCGLDFMEYKNKFLGSSLLMERLSELAELGLKSIMYAGEGEPLLHKQIARIINHTKKSGIDTAITTNGVFLKKALAEEILCNLEWIKVSINGGTGGTYAKIHQTKPAEFEKVIKNMKNAAKVRQEKGIKCILGMQLILLPENQHEVILLAELARDIGMDYLVVKPYSQHPLSKTKRYRNIKYNEYMHLADQLKKINTEQFNVVFRFNTMKKWDESDHSYNQCLALPFWSYMDSSGNVWGCSVYLGDERFYYGNIYDNSFKKIWEGDKRLKSLRWVEEELNANECRVNCRMDEINRHLWALKDPPLHVNFI